MSFQALKWAADQKLPAMQKIVLLMLANRMNQDTGLCCPSHDRLAEDCGMTKRSVIQQIEKLENENFLAVIRETKGSVKQVNKYRLHINRDRSIVNEIHYPSEPDSLPLVNDVHYPSEPDSLPLVNDVHYPSESGSLGVVNDVHINQEIKPGIKPVNLTTTTTTENLDEKNCGGSGGGDNFLELKNEVLAALIFPKSFSSHERQNAEKLLINCGSDAQSILDTLETSIRAGEVKKSSLSLLRGMIKRYEAGTFDPSPGIQISIERDKQQSKKKLIETTTNHETVMKNLEELQNGHTSQTDSVISKKLKTLQQKSQVKNLGP